MNLDITNRAVQYDLKQFARSVNNLCFAANNLALASKTQEERFKGYIDGGERLQAEEIKRFKEAVKAELRDTNSALCSLGFETITVDYDKIIKADTIALSYAEIGGNKSDPNETLVKRCNRITRRIKNKRLNNNLKWK